MLEVDLSLAPLDKAFEGVLAVHVKPASWQSGERGVATARRAALRYANIAHVNSSEVGLMLWSEVG